MSESENDEIPFEDVLGSLEAAATDVVSSGDYLSFLTLIDMYLTPRDNYLDEERAQLLDKLLAIFDKDHKIVFEIGWDLPLLLLTFMEHTDFSKGSIRRTPIVYKTLKIFELLALYGNPKELLLKLCEAISTIKITDPVGPDMTEEIMVMLYEIKFYCLIELIDSCLRKIATRYPLRFLLMAVTAVINLIYLNALGIASYIRFVLKRVFVFVSKYMPPPSPPPRAGVEGESPEEIAAILKDENALVRKLLRALCTEAVELLGRPYYLGYLLDHLTRIQEAHREKLPQYIDFKLEFEAMDRLVSLAQSFDIPLLQTFNEYVRNARSLISLTNSDQPEEAVLLLLFEKITEDYRKTQSSLILAEASEITLLLRGILILYTQMVGPLERWKDIKSFTFNDAMSFTIRSIVPGMVTPAFISLSIQDIAVFWLWVSLYKLSTIDIQKEILAIPAPILKVYFQCLLFALVLLPQNGAFRYMTLTLLTKILLLLPEETTYDFLKDSLYNCPFENIRAALGGVLKALLVVREGDIVQNLESLSIKDRSSEQSAPFISLSKDRALDLLDLLDFNRRNVFSKNVQVAKIPSLLSILNLFVVIKGEPEVTAEKPSARLKEIILEILKGIKKTKDSEEDPQVVNLTDLLLIAIERL